MTNTIQIKLQDGTFELSDEVENYLTEARFMSSNNQAFKETCGKLLRAISEENISIKEFKALLENFHSHFGKK